MKIIEKIIKKQSDLNSNPAVTIGVIGDSVSQGCFECYLTSETTLETVFDYESSYSHRLKQMLNLMYPNVQFNFINAGISGDSAQGGVARLERDILSYNPDLVIVGFALNDACAGLDGLAAYKRAMTDIVLAIKAHGAECIVLTPNAMNVNTSCHLKDDLFIKLSKDFAQVQLNGVLDKYAETAAEVAKSCGAALCDVYSKWKKMLNAGVNVTELLANKLNHPIRQLHYMTAMMLCDCILG